MKNLPVTEFCGIQKEKIQVRHLETLLAVLAEIILRNLSPDIHKDGRRLRFSLDCCVWWSEMRKTWARCDKSLTNCRYGQSILVCFGGIWELDGLWSHWFTRFHDFWRWEGSRSSNGDFENFCIVDCPLRGSFYLFTFCSTYVRYTPLLAVCWMTWENYMKKRKWFLPIPRNKFQPGSVIWMSW